MDIIIAGAGTVGYSLAQALSYQHNVTIIDKDQGKLDRLDEDIDILVLRGDVEDPKTYKALLHDKIDLFIAVTDSDEANLLATLVIEDEITVSRKIVRLKNEGFLKSHVLDKLSIDYAVFPDLTTANKVKALLTFPKANNVKVFHQTKLKLISIKAQYSQEKDFCVKDLCGKDVTVAGIDREKQFFIPSVDERIKPNDLIYLFGSVESIEKIAERLDEKMPSSIKKVVIFGANTQAQKIAKALLEKSLEIKMIEKERALCLEASSFLEGRVSIIHTAYDDHRLFEEEGVKYADMVIAAGQNDEKNIVKCVEAKEYGIQKVVAINNDKSYYDLMHKMGVVVVRGSKAGAHFAILEKIASSAIVTQRLFCGGAAVMFMRKIYPDSVLVNKKISTCKAEHVVSWVIRESYLIPLENAGRIEAGDSIVAFGKIDDMDEIQQWIYTL
jgi:trk system potassium uptake protein TrkA